MFQKIHTNYSVKYGEIDIRVLKLTIMCTRTHTLKEAVSIHNIIVKF